MRVVKAETERPGRRLLQLKKKKKGRDDGGWAHPPVHLIQKEL